MEATPADMAALAAETRPQDPPKLRVRDGVMRNSRDDKTILLLLLLAFICQSVLLISAPPPACHAVPPKFRQALLCFTR